MGRNPSRIGFQLPSSVILFICTLTGEHIYITLTLSIPRMYIESKVSNKSNFMKAMKREHAGKRLESRSQSLVYSTHGYGCDLWHLFLWTRNDNIYVRSQPQSPWDPIRWQVKIPQRGQRVICFCKPGEWCLAG